jgi:malonyl-CoA O-methyltransferase
MASGTKAPGTVAPGTLAPRRRDLYDLWSESYPPVAHNPVMRLEQSIVAPILQHLRARRALDVGTGSGRYMSVLADAGASTVVGADLSMSMLVRAGGRLVCADASSLPFRPHSFDVVNASLMAGDVEVLAPWVREMTRVLARVGHLVYSDFHPSWAEHGWKRTFVASDGATHELGFVPHTIDDHLAALETSGLRVLAIREPRFGDGDAAVQAFRRRWGNPPVLAVFHAIKE